MDGCDRELTKPGGVRLEKGAVVFREVYFSKHFHWSITALGFAGGSSGKEPACQGRRHKRHFLRVWRVRSLGREDPLEEGMATHSSIPAWRIPRTEEPGGLQSTGSQRVGHDLAHMHAQLL